MDEKNQDNESTSYDEKRELRRAISFFSQISVTIVACILIGILLGRFLDNYFGTSPWLLLVFTLLGMAAAFKSLFDLGMKK